MRFSISRIALMVCAVLLAGTMSSEEGSASDDVDLDQFLTHIETLSCSQATTFIEARRPAASAEVSPARQHSRALLEVALILSRCALSAPSAEKLREGQLRGMIAALGDPHAAYLNKKDYPAFNESFLGSYSGIGVDPGDDPELFKQGVLKVDAVFAGSPAEKAGITAGDSITEVDGRSIGAFKSRDEVIRVLKGESGKPVRLRMRTKNGESVSRTIVRGVIKKENVTYTVLPSKWLHLRVRSFMGDETTNVFGHATNSMCNDIMHAYGEAQQAAGPLEGVILNLGGNGGGLVGAAGCTFALFAPQQLTGKPFIFVRKRDGVEDFPFIVRSVNLLRGKPLVVLVDEKTASASEIVAKALQCNKLAVIVGVPTYGKGLIQATSALFGNETGIHYTIAEYFVGAREMPCPVQGVGVTPDILLKKIRVDDLDQTEIVRERDILGFTPSTLGVKDVLPRNIEAENPELYRRIMEILAEKPFELMHDK